MENALGTDVGSATREGTGGLARPDAAAGPTEPETRTARFFAVVDGDDPSVRSRRLGAYEFNLALIVVVEYWLRAIPKWGLLAGHYDVLLGLATFAGLTIVATRFRRSGFALLAVAHAVLVTTEFPSTGNHAYLELILCALAAFLDRNDAAQGRLYLQTLRWVVVVVLFYSGLQKLVQGHWVRAEFLAFSVATESFRNVLAPLLSPVELARLAALRGEVGDGPYHAASLSLRIVANATWIAEIALGPALCWRRSRAVALAITLLLLAAIEVGAREVFFGLVFANAILSFAHRDLHSLSRPIVVGLLALLALSRLGVIPEATFY